MKLRLALGIATLFASISGLAEAATIKYHVDFTVKDFLSSNQSQVTGFIETDGTTGVISAVNITDYMITADGLSANSIRLLGDAVVATGSTLTYDFGQLGSVLEFDNGATPVVQFLGTGILDGRVLASNSGIGDVQQFYPPTYVLAFASATTAPTVPLPASAPLFGAGLIAAGAVGYASKRKRTAAA